MPDEEKDVVRDRTEALSLIRALQLVLNPEDNHPPLMKHEYAACENIGMRVIQRMNAGDYE